MADYGNTRQRSAPGTGVQLSLRPADRPRPQIRHSNRILDADRRRLVALRHHAYRTGAPLSVSFTVPSSIIGWWGGRADAVQGGQIYAGQSNSHDVVRGVQWFNPAAFAPPQPWQWGNSERNSVYGPGSWNWDIGVQKFVVDHRTPPRADSRRFSGRLQPFQPGLSFGDDCGHARRWIAQPERGQRFSAAAAAASSSWA